MSYRCALALVLMQVCVMPLMFGGRSAEGKAGDEAALKELRKTLAGGPIEIEAARTNAKDISAAQAREVASRATGGKLKADAAWRVTVTDREFMGRWLKGTPCWLLRYDLTSFAP